MSEDDESERSVYIEDKVNDEEAVIVDDKVDSVYALGGYESEDYDKYESAEIDDEFLWPDITDEENMVLEGNKCPSPPRIGGDMSAHGSKRGNKQEDGWDNGNKSPPRSNRSGPTSDNIWNDTDTCE